MLINKLQTTILQILYKMIPKSKAIVENIIVSDDNFS